MMRRLYASLTLAAFVAAGIGAVLLYLDRSNLVQERRESLTTLEQEQLEFFRERTSLLLTIATLLVGAGGALLLRQPRVPSLRQGLALAVLLAAAISMLFGYLAYDTGEWMMRAQFFDLDTVEMRLPGRLQLWFLFVSLSSLIADFLLGSPHA